MGSAVGRTAAAVAVALALVGCGVPLEEQAVATPADALPYALQNPPTSRVLTAQLNNAVIYLVADDQLVGVQRSVTEPEDLEQLMTELTEPLSDAERTASLRRALSDGDLIGEVSENLGLASVELTTSFDRMPLREQILALGQVVFTLTELDEIDRVRFVRNGERLAIPTDNGQLVDTPVSRRNYANLR